MFLWYLTAHASDTLATLARREAADKTSTAPSDSSKSIRPHQLHDPPSDLIYPIKPPSDLINFIRYYLPHQTSSDLTNSSRLYQTLAIQSDIINPVNPIRSHLPHQIFLEFNNPPFNTLSINIFCLIYTALSLALFLFSHVQYKLTRY